MSYPIGLDEYDESCLVAELAGRQAARNAGKCDYCGRPFGAEPSCRMYGRHRGEVA